MALKKNEKAGNRLSIRVYLDSGARIGPGKIELLEAIAATGSISGGGRMLKMSYKRAWDLIEELNASFAKPLVTTATGGVSGGGAQLTPQGKALIEHYRQIENDAHEAVKPHIRALGRMTAKQPH